MVHETHCKFRGLWRLPGVGSIGISSAGGLVDGDLGPLGRRDSREEVVYFFGGAWS